MKLEIILAIVFGGAVLIIYSWIEKRINQQSCRECGFRASVDATGQQCPRCGATFEGKVSE